MQCIEAEGNSIDEAIARALALLGEPRERVEIEILANATRGLFGFGGKRARVRATLRQPVVAASGAPAAAPSAPAAAAAPARRAGDGAPPHAAVLERARDVLADIVRLSGMEASVRIAGARLVIEGDTGGVLIGRRGTTLDALEYVVNRAIGHDEERAAHVEVDANDYRARRRATLEDLARRMAERARSRGRPVALNPLSPRERRVVHLALQGDPTLTTHSAGDGFYRRLVIVPTAPTRRP